MSKAKASKQTVIDKKKIPKTAVTASKREKTDIVTGQIVCSTFLDPEKCLDWDDKAYNYDWVGQNLYIPAKIVREEGGIASVVLRSGETFRMRDAVHVTDLDDEGVDDILQLRDFSEMSLIQTLRVRYNRDDIYTFVGPILISLNPYKRIKDLYSEGAMSDYHGRRQGELPPHLFVLAEATYTALMSSKDGVKAKDQSIIISGESGAGKTEATKVIMAFLTRITAIDAANGSSASGSQSPAHVNVGELEQKVLNTNPLLEAFGNARTLRNDNSSRFGKFIKIQFSKSGRIVGATIEKYLLEKTRIIYQTPGERNYHIFYQLLRGASDALLEEIVLSRSIDKYWYLTTQVAASTDIPNVNDHTEFQNTLDCMNSVGVDSALQINIFKLLSGILHLGNVEYLQEEVEDQVGGVTADTIHELEAAARMLGFGTEELLTSMTKQNMYVGGNTIVKAQTRAQAMDKRNSFSKSIYSMLFTWLVDRMNLTIAPVDRFSAWGFIGLLDIYGFENFDGVNSFEQLLINYANEKMQSHFNRHIFTMEQSEYSAEGIDWSYIQFSDNLPCVELIDGKPNGKSGIFQTLDDVAAAGRNDINANFLITLNQSWSGSSVADARHTNYVAPRFNSDQRFGVLHYAGEVFYEISGFAEKNRDSTNNDMKELMARSNNELLRTMTEETLRQDAAIAAGSAISGSGSSTPVLPGTTQKGKKPSATGGSGKSVHRSGSFVSSKLKEDSISKQFVASLGQLFNTLETTEPHFVRCVKPNIYKRSDCMNATETLQQLRYAGMMETIRIRQAGYALRLPTAEFFRKYCRLSPKSKTVNELVSALSRTLSVSRESWQIGVHKIFMKREMGEKLEQLLRLLLAGAARKIQKQWRHLLHKRAVIKAQSYVRAFIHKMRFLRARKHILKLQTVYRGFRHAKTYRNQLRAVVHIQRMAYGRMARVLARSMRNPFNRMNYEELTVALKKAEGDLKTAFEEKDFDACAALDTVIADIRTARAKLPLPDVIPTSRKEVEKFILEMHFAIEYYQELQDFASIPALNERLLKLEKYRTTFPTSEEVASELSTVRATLATAMKKKEFKKCGELQEKVTRLESQLAEIEKSSSGQLVLRSVEDLKAMRDDCETKMAAAMVAKNFDLCDALQCELDMLVDVITRKDLTMEEASAMRAHIHYEMKVSRETREFLRMAELQEDFDLLSDVIVQEEARALAAAEAEAAVMQEVEAVPAVIADPLAHKSYDELSAEIDTAAKELELAVVAKDYRKCDELEKNIQTLQAARAKLPVPEPKYTRAELVALIQTKTAEIDAALNNKQYKLCDELNAELDRLKAKLEAMPTAASVGIKLKELQDRLKQLIATKQYGLCADVEAEIVELTPLHERLQAEEPKVEPKVQPVPVKGVKVLGAVAVKPAVASGKASAKSPTVMSVSVKAPSVLKDEVVKPIAKKQTDERSVAKLRPKAPITASDSCNIYEVAMKMAASRADAALLLDDEGALSGILTDNDVTRRVVSQFVNPVDTGVKDVMTKGPKCVRNEDSALDALEMMVDNRFRHLPVLDKDGVVVGLLDIAKCLYDAISVLEKVHGDDSKENSGGAGNGAALANVMSTAMKTAAGGRGTNKAQMAAMQLLMEQMFGGSVPTLRTIVGKESFAFIQPTTTIREASQLMAKARKGVLVMESKKRTVLLGILTPKDLLNRVIAKGLSPDMTLVGDVMTPNPDSVLADLTLIDALREMHDHKYLHLPVRDDDGTVLGVVDVMELVCSTAGGENGGKGWRDFFSGAMNARGDSDSVSDAGSGYSGKGSKGRSVDKPVSKPVATRNENERSVAKLRPKAPITASDSCNIYEVAMKMAASRADAALLLDDEGALSGILTDNDVTRRVVSQFVNPVDTGVKDVMTKGPKCVRNEDSALDALEMMVDNRFRHLPVLDKDGVVVGLLDIAKCLYDAISVLEKVHGDDSKENSGGAGNGAALANVMSTAMKTAAGGRGANKAQMAAMQLLMEQMFGGSVPTLRTIVGKESFAFIQPTTTIREASQLMAKARKGVLVMESKKRTVLLGILTPKDLLNRVIAKGLSPDTTLVGDVMTPNPDSVLADLTLIDALREMHDHKYLHLPVRDDDGAVLGVVDVMELVCSTAGGENGGKGWRDFFSGAMNARGDSDSVSDAGSGYSGKGSKGRSVDKPVSKPVATRNENERSVAKLRPKAPITASDSCNIYEVAMKMAACRADAALLLDDEGALSGILTDNDVTRRVVSQFVNPVDTGVKDVMTKGPKCVRNEDSALDALEMMVDNRFRHLPVLDKDGVVVGLLDIAKCLYDAISVLEKVHGDDSKENSGGAGNGAALANVMSTAMKTAAAGGRGTNKAQMAAMQLLMEQMFGGSVPTLRTIVGKEAFSFIQPTTTIREASQLMAKARKGVLVMESKKHTVLLGILTPKDLLNRVIAKGLSPDMTLVGDVMTPNPDSVLADLTLIDALREMHDHKYLHLPVRDDDGTVLGVVDVMELVCSTAGGENGGKGWRDFFSGAMNARGDSDSVSDAGSGYSGKGSKGRSVDKPTSKPVATRNENERSVAKLRPKAPITASDSCNIYEVAMKMAASRADAALLLDDEGALSGILTDNDVTRRVVSQFVNPVDTGVKDVMTKGPKCVRNEDSALDALEMMVDNRFRHLPVLDKDGVVVGLLDIAKCLYDAISVLEKVHGDDSKENSGGAGNGAALANVMSTAMKTAAGGRGTNKAQMAAMQLLMEQMFGGSVPTLRTIVGKEAFSFIQPTTTIRGASQLMAKARKGVLVMESKKRTVLLGILTPKDLLNRVIAKGLSPDTTLVGDVMTPNPDSVLADLTLIDALREMHDHKYLHLPVRDDDGTVLGVVDVMELVCSTAGGENGGKGWRDFFSGAMNARGDSDSVSDAGSGYSGKGSKGRSVDKPTSKPVATRNENKRSVAKLRPKAPITASDSCNIYEVAMKMAASRADAALLLDDEGALSGILTDNDVTRRVVSQFVNPVDTGVKDVMTKGPKCVRNEDSALDALEMMVDNRFRHLPVLDKDGVVVGLLDIAKCLYDAISVLEKVHGDDSKENSGSAGNGAALANVMSTAMKTAAGGRGTNKAQMAAMQLLMEQMFGGSVPTLRTIVGKEAFAFIQPTTTIREASQLMAKARKGVLVMESKKRTVLLGILTPKDLLNRVIAKGLSPDTTLVGDVMTPNPDSVLADLTLIDALREMHDHKYLHLPVRDDDGTVLGVVDVMELVCSTAGGENGGKGWRDFFSGAMNARGDSDSVSDAGSGYSGKGSKGRSVDKPTSKPAATRNENERSVAKLRPKAPITASDSCNIYEVAMKMAASRADAALLLDDEGALSGILTDNDVTRRVVSQFVNPVDTGVKDVMTKGPKCVRNEDSALDALEMMVDNRFRHLPVLDKDGVVVGLLDIAKCLYDAISVLEKVHGDDSKENSGGAGNGAALANVMSTAMKTAAGGRGTNKAQMAAMQLLMEQMFGGSVPTLRSIIGNEELSFVRQTINVREASCIMAKFRKGLLVLDEDEELVGIITPKDVLMRVLAQNKSPDLTAVSSVMTPNPDCVSPDLTLIDALREMHDHKYLHLPVRDDDGTVIGLVDVMELVCSTAGGKNGGKGWRDFFSGAMNARGDDRSDTASNCSSISAAPKPIPIRAKYLEQQQHKQESMSALTYSIQGDHSEFFHMEFDFKVSDVHGHLHKVKCNADSLTALKAVVSEKVAIPVASLLLKYRDEDKDEITLSSDASLKDAVEYARSMGQTALKISAITVPVEVAASISRGEKKASVASEIVTSPPAVSSGGGNTMLIVGGGVAVVAVIAAAAFILMRKK